MKQTYASVILIFALLVMGACGGSSRQSEPKKEVSLSERDSYRYEKALSDIEAIETLLFACKNGASADIYTQLLAKARDLKYEYNGEGMNEATIAYCEVLVARVDSLQRSVVALVEESLISGGEVSLFSMPTKLVTEKTETPVYLYAGEKLFVELSSSEGVTYKLCNYDTQRTLKRRVVKSLKDSLKIDYSGIYTISVEPTTRCYASLDVKVRPAASEGIYMRPHIFSETVQCGKGEWGAKAVKAIDMRNLFDEPRKITLRGQLKAAFSGNAGAVVALHLPSGATDVLYSIRIATSEQSRSSDGEFHNNLTHSYHKIKMLGLPFYESEKRRGLFVTLLDDNRPIREEDAYCNMYLFRNQSQAKQFQDGTKDASLLNYDMDYSAIGTQSCNGRIATNGARILYMGFENERMRYTNYLWVEAVAVVPTTEYYTTKYSVQ